MHIKNCCRKAFFQNFRFLTRGLKKMSAEDVGGDAEEAKPSEGKGEDEVEPSQVCTTLSQLLCTDIKCEAPEKYVESIVCKSADIKNNEMKVFNVDGAGEVLLIRQGDILSAIGTKCSHYGGPLVTGALGKGRVRCPWHGACFNIETGDIEEFPGLDSLPCYEVSTTEDDKIIVRAKVSDLRNPKRVKEMAKYNAVEDDKSFIIIGGGPAGAVCAETLRQEGFIGRIALICKENYLPYERVKLSKVMNVPIQSLQFRTEEFYRENGIEVIKNAEATKIDVERKIVILNCGRALRYDQLFVATGSRPMVPDIPGVDLKNVFILRDYEDAKRINSSLCKHKEIVILGGSFIATEVAAYCADKVRCVTVVMRKTKPLEALLGPNVSEALMKLFQEKGVRFIENQTVATCIDDGNGAICKVRLTNGDIVKADVFVMGTGSIFNTEILTGIKGIKVQKNGSVDVNNKLQTGIPNIFVGGDIASAPVFINKNKKEPIGHFGIAHQHGRIAALNMLEKETPLKIVPYFWTMVFGKSIRFAGKSDYKTVVYAGSIEEMKFVAFYIKGQEVVAVASCMMDPYVSKFAEMLAQGKKLMKNKLKKDPLAWAK